MFKVSVINEVNGTSYGAQFETIELAQAWANEQIEKDSCGKKERVMLEEQVPEELSSRVINLFDEILEEERQVPIYQKNEDGSIKMSLDTPIEKTNIHGDTYLYYGEPLQAKDENGNFLYEIIPAVTQKMATIKQDYMFFDTEGSKHEAPVYMDISAQVNQEKINMEAQKYLSDTDWICHRHLDQKELGISTSLTEEEFQQLLQARQAARNQIVR